MITRIAIENFKSLRKVDLSLGRMNLFIGANASGKSNFLDALRVLEGIGRGFTINETLNGKPRGATNEVWEGIRGGSSHACFAGSDGTGSVTAKVHGRLEGDPVRSWEFSITFLPTPGQVSRERLQVGEVIYDADQVTNSQGVPTLQVRHYYVNRERPHDSESKNTGPVLGGFAGLRFFGFDGAGVGFDQGPFYTEGADLARRVAALLANTQRVDPLPPMLQQYSPAHHVRRMGDHGEDFAALVKTICQDEKAKDAYMTWLRQLRPEQIDDVGTLDGAIGEPMFLLREDGREFPAQVLSDGTLRFAAIAAAFFQKDMPNLMTIEEIEKGIHASRLQLLLELMRSQAEYHRTQVVATTHSATVLDWLQEEDYKTTFLCRRDESTGESRICSLADVPHFVEVVKKKPASELCSEGWLEMAP